MTSLNDFTDTASKEASADLKRGGAARAAHAADGREAQSQMLAAAVWQGMPDEKRTHLTGLLHELLCRLGRAPKLADFAPKDRDSICHELLDLSMAVNSALSFHTHEIDRDGLRTAVRQARALIGPYTKNNARKRAAIAKATPGAP